MATHRKPRERGAREQNLNVETTVQQDEADVLEEAGAVRDEETGDLVVDEATVRELGAVDATSVRENRRLDRVVQKKRAGEKDVPFNTKDPIVIYGTLLRYWTPDSIDITVKCLLGGATTLLKCPINGAALYEAIMHCHGQQAETEYEIKFTSSGKYMGLGRIKMPDTRPSGQQGQPVQYQPPPPQYPPQPGYPPQQAPQPPYAMPVAPQAPPPASDPMAMMNQMFQLFQQMQASVQPPPQPQFQPPPAMPPMPSPQANPAEAMAWMQQAFGMLQKMQQGTAPAQVVVQPAPPPPPSPAGGIAETMTVMKQMFEMFQSMQPPPPRQEPFRGGRPPHYPQGDRPPSSFSPDGQRPQQQPPQRQLTMAEQFKESIGVVRTAVGVIEEMDSLLPGRGGQQEAASMLDMDDDDNPIKIVDTGRGKLAVNKSDGALRWVETGMMALPDLLKWLSEQHQVIQEANKDRQRPRRQLAPGYVEVGPGYRPPPGYDAVPVEEEDLPPPPEHMPPPIQETPARRAWGAPVIPDQQEEN
jgi:hypothetical protein